MKKWLGMFLAAGLFVACGDDDKKANNTENNPPNNTTNNNSNNSSNNNSNNAVGRASFATYNVGLAVGFVPLAEERKQAVINAIPDIDADVLCLQEVWLDQAEGVWSQDTIDGIIAASSSAFPHNYYVITEDEGEGAGCTEEEAAPLVACANEHCSDVPPADLAGCILPNCGDEFGAVSTECSACLVGQLGNTFEDIQAACVGGTQSAFYSNGHSGLLLLSKHPLSATFHEKMGAVQVSRSLLAANTTIPDVGNVRVYCTHLTADITGVSYPGDDFPSYEAEQKVQVERLIALVGAETLPTVVLGDFNTGPATNQLDAELPANYQLFVDAGWVNIYVDFEDAECTYCSGNTLVGNSGDKVIDHVFLSGATPVEPSAAIIFSETVSIDGQTTHLSDHYGVRASFGIE